MWNTIDWELERGDWLTYVPEVRRYTGDAFDPLAPPGVHGARFRYLVVTPDGGQTKGTIINAGIDGNLKASARHARTVIHELGHSLGLEHGGHASDDLHNCKPNYPSIMNYAFNAKFFGFSKGLNGALDPGMVHEVNAFSGSAIHLGDTSSLTDFQFPVATADGSVDFNRSQNPAIFQGPLGFVRAGVTHAAAGGCAAALDQRSDVHYSPFGSATGITPALAVFRGRVWSFWVEGNRIKYSSDIHTGPNAAGSCATGTGTTGETCNSWCALGGCDPNVVHEVPLSTDTPVDGISALAWREESANGGQLVLAYTTDQSVFVRTAIGLDGARLVFPPVALGSEPPAFSDVMPDTEVELSYMYVNRDKYPDVFPSEVVLAAFTVEQQVGSPAGSGIQVWHFTTHPEVVGPANWFRREVILDVPIKPGTVKLITPISGRRAPGVSVWPNKAALGPHRSDIGFACGVFGRPTGTKKDPDVRDQPRLLCYKKDAEQWSFENLPGDHLISGRRPSIAYHTLRAASQGPNAPPLGETVAGDPTRGQFWMTLISAGKSDGSATLPFFLYSREVRSDAPPATAYAPGLQTVAGDKVWDDWTETRLRTGVVLRETLDLSALKAVMLLSYKEKDDDQLGGVLGYDVSAGIDRVKFLPFADGTFHATLRDTNDFRVMDRGTCLVLHAKDMSFEGLPCGPRNSAGY